MARTRYELLDQLKHITDVKILAEIEYALKYETNLEFYLPYGHPDTLCPNGKLWIEQNKRDIWEPWSNRAWQVEFHNVGINHKERMLICANGVGKSISGAYEASIHATGKYPDWWDGHRFSGATKGWIGSITNEVQKSYIQKLLVGEDLQTEMGTGFIPKSLIVGKPTTRQCGLSGVVDELRVKNILDGRTSIIQFKTYEQGWRKWQASAPDWVWLDEEPDENISDQKDIFPEVQTRLVRTSGILWVTYTPLLGQTHLTQHFLQPKDKSIIAITATWEDAPHLKVEDRNRLIATYPEHQVQARTQGVPMLGEGAIFTVPENEIKINPFNIPSHWARLKGIDFGINHPASMVELAWDRERDIIYVVRDWRQSNADVSTHCEAINRHNPWVSVAWPHDGHKRAAAKTGNVILKELYQEKGVKLLARSARYKNDIGGSQDQWPVIKEMQEREESGSLRVFSTCHNYLEERRNYHTKEGKIVSVRDDILKAAMYAIMQKRSASMQITPQRHQQRVPLGITMR
jgi:phage terminase large subunit-like protein